ncbi:hypothetical protein T440DRAFT_10373 [Plenodomus tracheiphilus IPT5]|uniref:Heterokaryon incompatibility domain-containing protein n=1 Tax=Plenodomus tracheiphilus IPT5 TaxID=1408161 RepID=A0A6A7BN50_9PLEO|nr:hypothetical protein T440DRAFT_10373 [Plenodomus tracheiphilus IPT5]
MDNYICGTYLPHEKSESSCRHPDIRRFDGLRCCLSCGETVFELVIAAPVHNANPIGRSHPYRYTSLNYKLGREIRLVVLLPGITTDILRCEIVHVNLEDGPEYEAVSYTWATEDGNCSPSHVIYCSNGECLTITASCDSALRQLRRPSHRRRLWIDAVCIQQCNLDERNHQVSFMGQIYARAPNVCVCLEKGLVPTHTRTFKALIRWLRRPESSNAEAVAQLENIIWPTLQCLLSSRYFKRVWVIQEVALAKSACLFIESHEVALDVATVGRMELLCTKNESQLPGVLRWSPGLFVGSDIIPCLRAGFDGESSDPRDRVFAVLSLMKPADRSLIPINYSLDVERVFANTVMAVITIHRNLNILAYAEPMNDEVHRWKGSLALSMEKFRRFLAAKSTQVPAKPTTLTEGRNSPYIDQFNCDSEGSWRAEIDVRSAEPKDQSRVDDTSTACIIYNSQLVQKGLLPRLSVRVHYIDAITTTASSSAPRWIQQLVDHRILGLNKLLKSSPSQHYISHECRSCGGRPELGWLPSEAYYWIKPYFLDKYGDLDRGSPSNY